MKKYILVTIALVLLLAYVLHVRKGQIINQNSLNAFVVINEELIKTTANFDAQNATWFDIFDAQMDKSPVKVGPFRDKAYIVKDLADQLVYDLQELKVEIVKSCDGDNAPSLTPVEWYIGEKREKKSTFDVDGNLIIGKDNMDIPAKLMIIEGKGRELKTKIEKYRDFLVSLTYYDPSHKKFITDALDIFDLPGKEGIYRTWESYHFEGFPAIAVIANLSRIQNDIRIAETDILQSLCAQIGASDTRINRMEAVVLAKSRYVTKGDIFEARILMAAYDSLQKPEVVIGPYHKTNRGYELIGEGDILAYDAKGRAVYKAAATTVGDFTLQGIIKMMTPDGIINLPFSYEYHVVEYRVP